MNGYQVGRYRVTLIGIESSGGTPMAIASEGMTRQIMYIRSRRTYKGALEDMNA